METSIEFEETALLWFLKKKETETSNHLASVYRKSNHINGGIKAATGEMVS